MRSIYRGKIQKDADFSDQGGPVAILRNYTEFHSPLMNMGHDSPWLQKQVQDYPSSEKATLRLQVLKKMGLGVLQPNLTSWRCQKSPGAASCAS